MMFLWHHALWLLLALPVLVGTYIVLLGRKSRQALRYAGFQLARGAISPAQRLRPHAPPLLLLMGLAALLLAVARPVMILKGKSEQGTVILLMDVSLSMAASDVLPTRLAAARAAALRFIDAQPRNVRIGVVAFGAHADVVQPPTSNRAHVLAALDRLELQRFTAIGNGLIGALLTLVPTADIGHEFDIFGAGKAPAGTQEIGASATRTRAKAPQKPVPAGSDRSAAIILVSDGRGTMGIPAVKAARMAADLGIRVYTVGVGTLYGGVANVEGWPTIHAEFDEAMLQEIADITRGEYFLARTADKLTRIYETLGTRVVLESAQRELTALFTAIGVVLLLASATLSVFWSNRLERR
jgi:Ca-activated chloride channel family protein